MNMPTQEDVPITIRHARTGDEESLAAFIAPFVEDGKLLQRTTEELAGLLPNFFLATREEKIVACAALEIYSPKLAEIRSLAVAPECQGTGVGKRLVQACIDLAHERNILEVMAITSSESFFMACGFNFTLPDEKKALFIRTRDV